jgi:hypothetical protein
MPDEDDRDVWLMVAALALLGVVALIAQLVVLRLTGQAP